MDNFDDQLGQIIREYRIKSELTQLELATKLGHKTSQFVSLFERGQSKVPLETLGTLIALLQIPESKVKRCLLNQYAIELEQKIKIGKRKFSKAV